MKTRLGFMIVLGLAIVSPAFGAAQAPRDCRNGSRTLENVALAWVPTEDVAQPKVQTITPGAAAAPPSLRIEIQALADARETPKRIGENREDLEKTGCIYPVTTKDDAAAWTTDRFRFLLGRLGFHVGDKDGDVVLSGELRQFFVTEGGTYDGEIGLKLDVVSKDGKALWSGIVRGTSGHWGKSYKLANYHETLSDTLIDLVQHLAADPNFLKSVGADASSVAAPTN